LYPVLGDNGRVTSGASELGWTCLREGNWTEARSAFERALAEHETGEALEGSSWAAWWLDDGDAVFDARERAYRRYRADGNPSAAARMATWLAADELDFRASSAVASGWLQRARRLLEPLEPGPDHGWLAFHEGFVAHAGGDGAKAIELAVQAAELGRRFDVADLEMLGLALQGAALVAGARVEDGMRCLDEATATALAGEAAIPISSAWTCCFLVSACTSVLDYERAAEWCDRIAEFAERYGSRYMLGFCRAEYGAVHLWRGRWSEAESLLEEAIEAFARSRPPYASGPLAGLAELRRRQGRPDEAAELLDRAGATTAAGLCRARLALDAGDPQRATELLERLRRRDPGPGLAPVLELLVRASLARGEPAVASAALTELRRLEQLVGAVPLKASADLADGMVSAARGDHEQARALLEDAVDGYGRSGAPYEAAQASIELAATLAALGRNELADAETAAAVDSLRKLGALSERPSAEEVTPREREVLALLAEGLTNRQIAEQLVLSEHTVHRHVSNILRKLDLPTRAAAAAHAARTGL
jgi:LuxR family transcriptional regulator, maltose regulon positive regulatory protein